MTSDTLTSLFKQLGIETSRNRPRVSNDNPHAECLASGIVSHFGV